MIDDYFATRVRPYTLARCPYLSSWPASLVVLELSLEYRCEFLSLNWPPRFCYTPSIQTPPVSALLLVADTQFYKRLCPSVRPSVHRSVGPSVMVIELKSVKTRIFAPAHPSATGIGRASGLVVSFSGCFRWWSCFPCNWSDTRWRAVNRFRCQLCFIDWICASTKSKNRWSWPNLATSCMGISRF